MRWISETTVPVHFPIHKWPITNEKTIKKKQKQRSIYGGELLNLQNRGLQFIIPGPLNINVSPSWGNQHTVGPLASEPLHQQWAQLLPTAKLLALPAEMTDRENKFSSHTLKGF